MMKKQFDTLAYLEKSTIMLLVALLLSITAVPLVTAADATDDLLAKQVVLVEKWGAKEVDRVTKKSWWKPFDPDRVEGLNKLVKGIPEGEISNFDSSTVVTLLGRKGFADSVEIGLNKVLMKVGKVDGVAPGASTVERLEFFDNVAKMSTRVADDVAEVADVKGIHKLTDRITKGDVGAPFEAETARLVRQSGDELIEIGNSAKRADFIDPETGILRKNVEFEMTLRPKK